MANLIAAIVMTLSVLEGHSPVAGIFNRDISYQWHVVWSYKLFYQGPQCMISLSYPTMCLQCFDAVGWAAGKASGL